ncbi:MAG: carbon-nitrogen hydrolase family protein [Acidimicrobiales bacterium]
MRAAAVQVATTFDAAENRRLVSDRIGAAARAGAHLVVLPEATMCTFGGPSFDLAAVAEPLDGPFFDAVRTGAARHGLTVVAGMFERSARAGRAFNTVVVAGPVGELLGAYRKLHLFDALGAMESARLDSGDPESGLVTFEVGGMVAGIMTCYDLRFPEMARALVDRGAELLVLPAHWYSGPGKPEVWATLVRARAIESTAYVVAAGKPAPEGVGRSVIVDPMGEVCAALGEDDDDCAVADVEASRVAEVRRVLPVLEHRRFDVVARVPGARPGHEPSA